MKIKDLTVEYIMSLDQDSLHEVQYKLTGVRTCTRKTLRHYESRPVVTERDGRELAGARNAYARVEALCEAVMCREDELVGPGVFTSYDHTERFV